MSPLNKPYSVLPLKQEASDLTVFASELLPLGEDVSVQDHNGQEAEVQMTSCRRTLDGNWLFFGQLKKGCLEPKPLLMKDFLRRCQRLPIGLRVRSEQLPAFRGVTNDLSERGVQVLAEQPMKVGTTLDLTLDLDDGGTPLTLFCDVRWSELSQPARVGLCFLDGTPEQARRLLNYLATRSPENVVPSLSTEDPGKVTPKVRETVLQGTTLISAYRHDGDLTLLLENQGSQIEYNFSNPKLSVSNLEQIALSKMTFLSQGEGQGVYCFYDDKGELVLELTSDSPQVIVQATVA